MASRFFGARTKIRTALVSLSAGSALVLAALAGASPAQATGDCLIYGTFTAQGTTDTCTLAAGATMGWIVKGGNGDGAGAKIKGTYTNGGGSTITIYIRLGQDGNYTLSPVRQSGSLTAVYIGGVFGRVYATNLAAAGFTNVYSAATMTPISPAPSGLAGFVGGTQAVTSGPANNGFYDTTVSTLVSPGPNGTGQTTTALTTIGTFTALSPAWPITSTWAAWDGIANVWGICSSVNGGYPYLLWQYTYDPCPPPAPSGGGSTVATSAGAPSAPRNVQVTPGNAMATVSWQAPATDNGAVVTGYVVAAFPGTSTCSTGSALTCVVRDLVNGTRYTFAVYARNSAGRSAAGNGEGTPFDPLDPITASSGVSGSSALPADGLGLGQSLLLVNGVPTAVSVRPNASTSPVALVVESAGLNMRLEGRGDVNDPLGLTSKHALILESVSTTTTASRSLSMVKQARVTPVAKSSGDGFAASSPVRMFLLPATYLGTLTTDASGAYTGQVPIPAGITPGRYTLQANGTGADGSVRSLSLGVQVIGTKTRAGKARTYTAKVYFDSLSSALTPIAKATLNRLVEQSGKKASKVVSVGYVQPTKSTANDKALSTSRARAVANYLRAADVSGVYSVRGTGKATQTGAVARRVQVTVIVAR